MKIRVEEVNKQFELKVCIPLRKEHDSFIATTLATATGKMSEKVDAGDVTSKLQTKPITKLDSDSLMVNVMHFSPSVQVTLKV